MSDSSLQEQIRKLIALQKVDILIYEHERTLNERPREIEELREEFEQKKSRFNELESQLKGLKVGRKEAELELQGKEDEIAKANTALGDIKTNKEYTAKIKEIESLKADKSRVEDTILASYDRVEEVEKMIEDEKRVIADQEKDFNARKAGIEDELSRLKTEVGKLKEARQGLVPGVDKAYLLSYERLIEHKNGLGIVPVQGNSCGGCYMMVTPQMLNRIKIADEIVTCEFCNRMLYMEDRLS